MGGLVLLCLVACGGKAAPVEATAPPRAEAPAGPRVVFQEVALPAAPQSLMAPVATASVRVDGADYHIGYHPLFRTGDMGFGQVLGADGEPLEGLCNEQDFNSLIDAHGVPWLVSHFECTPGGVNLTKLSLGAEGLLTPVSTKPIDFAAVGGAWIPCSGQVSPWNTHLGSEEYEPNARRTPVPADGWSYGAWQRMLRYEPGAEYLYPYLYGWSTEIEITTAQGTTEVSKRYAMGRFSHELAYVLPDRRTVYLSDDGYAVGWFMFVADTPGDLSAGKLYAAKWHQREDGSADLTWISLGHATDAQVLAAIKGTVGFAELIRAIDVPEAGCPPGTEQVKHTHGEECLALAEGADEAVVSRLETRRYAGLKGATLEFYKGEGVTYDAEADKVYVSMSRIGEGMSDGVGDIHIPENRCGVVFSGQTASGQVDDQGQAIESEHVMIEMVPAVTGLPVEADGAGNTCAVGSMANPDNITFLSGYGQLVIAEDTHYHEVASLWAYDVNTKGLTRLMVAPPHGELTGIHWIPDLMGRGYLTAVVQHPWEMDPAELPEGVTEADQRTFTGYLGPFPKLTP